MGGEFNKGYNIGYRIGAALMNLIISIFKWIFGGIARWIRSKA